MKREKCEIGNYRGKLESSFFLKMHFHLFIWVREIKGDPHPAVWLLKFLQRWDDEQVEIRCRELLLPLLHSEKVHRALSGCFLPHSVHLENWARKVLWAVNVPNSIITPVPNSTPRRSHIQYGNKSLAVSHEPRGEHRLAGSGHIFVYDSCCFAVLTKPVIPCPVLPVNLATVSEHAFVSCTAGRLIIDIYVCVSLPRCPLE